MNNVKPQLKRGDPQFDHVDTAICIWEWVETHTHRHAWLAVKSWLNGGQEASISDTRCAVVGLALAVSNAYNELEPRLIEVFGSWWEGEAFTPKRNNKTRGYKAVGTNSDLPWDDQFVWPLCQELKERGITGFYDIYSGELIDKTEEVTAVAAECVPKWAAAFWGES